MRKRIYQLISVIFLGLSVPVYFGLAHQTGASWEKIVDGYKVDIGYDPTTITAGESQRFDFNAYDTKTSNPPDFSDIWVRISLGEQTVFASGIHKPELGLPGMIFVFPKEGNYTLDVRFENSDTNFVETTLPISVGKAEDDPASLARNSNSSVKIILFSLGGLLIGAAAAWVVLKKKAAKHA